MQENYNAGSEGAESQIGDGEVTEISNRKLSPPISAEETQGSATLLHRGQILLFQEKKLIWLVRDKYSVIHLPLSPSTPKSTESLVKIAIFG